MAAMIRWSRFAVPSACFTVVLVACSSFTSTPGEVGADAAVEASASTDASVDLPVALAAGTNVACVLRQSGRLACWGSNVFGAIGVDPTNDQNCAPASNSCRQAATTPAFVEDIRQVSVSEEVVCAVTNGGALLCWGRNDVDGALGSGSPIPDHVVAPYLVTAVSNVIDVATSKTGGCARTGGSGGVHVVCWGATGLGLTGQAPDPARVTGPVAFPALDGAKVVRLSSEFPAMACAVMGDDHVACWGTSQHGNLGSAPTLETCILGFSCASVPSPIGDGGFLADDVQVGKDFACALRAGVVSCWGYNGVGALGLGKVDDDAHPVPVVVPGLGEVTKLSARAGHVCALSKGSGELRCWGLGSSGELAGFTGERGALSRPCASTPTRATDLSEVEDVATGTGFTLVRKGDRIYAWGDNSSGQLGHPRSDDRAGVCLDPALTCNPAPTPVVLP